MASPANEGGIGGKFRKRAVRRPPATPSAPASQKWTASSPMEEDGLVHIDSSSDSESEDIAKRKNENSPKGINKASKETTKSGKKSSLANLKTGVRFSADTPSPKGDSGKGGKGFTSGKAAGNGGFGFPRSSAVKPPVTEVELKLQIEHPKNARVLMDCEAANILQGIQESLTLLSDDPNIKMPDSFNKALNYCKSRNHYTNTESAKQILETLKGHGVTEGEICMIGNICPENIGEVYALIPSLKANRHKNEGPIREALVNLADFIQS